MSALIESNVMSWLAFDKPIRNPYVKIELTKEQKEDLNKWNIWDEPWDKANDILKKEAYVYLGRCNGKSDALNALIYGIDAYGKIKEKEMKNDRNRPEIEKVIFNPPATIVKWSDGTKTVVKCQEGDEFDPEIGLAMAISRKYFGSRNQMLKIVEEEYWENPRFFRAESDESIIQGGFVFKCDAQKLSERLKRVADHLRGANKTGE